MTLERYKQLVEEKAYVQTDAENKMHVYYMAKSIKYMLIALVVLEIIDLITRRRA